MGAMTPDRIHRYGLDAKKQPCSEGYYVRGKSGELIIVPPTAEVHPSRLADGYRMATAAEVESAGGAKDGVGRHAAIEELVIPESHPDYEWHPDSKIEKVVEVATKESPRDVRADD